MLNIRCFNFYNKTWAVRKPSGRQMLREGCNVGIFALYGTNKIVSHLICGFEGIHRRTCKKLYYMSVQAETFAELYNTKFEVEDISRGCYPSHPLILDSSCALLARYLKMYKYMIGKLVELYCNSLSFISTRQQDIWLIRASGSAYTCSSTYLFIVRSVCLSVYTQRETAFTVTNFLQPQCRCDREESVLFD